MKLLDIIFESVVDMEEGRKPITKDEFVRRSKEVHGDKYTYDNVVYIASNKKVMITCPLHGDFPQSPSNHLLGKEGCKPCYSKLMSSNTEDFIKKAQQIHFLYDEDGKKIPKYTYDNVVYYNAIEDVNITCPLHGDFPQPPRDHLVGKGCYECGIESRKSNTKDFIKNSQEIHFLYDEDGNKIPKYTYDNVVYIASYKKVMITCPIHSPKHGDFPQSPNNHLQGYGCPWCKESKGEKRIKQILFEKSINYIQQKKYDDCISYRSRNGLSKTCFKLKFDFYLSENNTLVEYDGEYHFKQNYNVSLEEYINGVFNDREKNEYAKAKNIKLIRIGYLDKENIEEELMKGLDSNDQLYLSTKYPIGKGWGDTTIKI
jgi:hypothetical protein